jgi:hypothetical protein
MGLGAGPAHGKQWKQNKNEKNNIETWILKRRKKIRKYKYVMPKS